VKFGTHTDRDTRLCIMCDVCEVTTKLSPYTTWSLMVESGYGLNATEPPH